jgi:hypothetical protein
MIARKIVLQLVSVALWLVACQPLPHPFETDHDMPAGRLMALPDVVGVAIEPVRGVPTRDADAIQSGLVKALQDADIPASPAPGGEHAFHVTGEASGLTSLGATTRLSLSWIVTSASGDEIGRAVDTITMDSASWQSGDPDLGAPMRTAASEIAGILHLPDAAPPPPPAPEPPPPLRLVIGTVTGAPGDGDTSLPRALAFALGDSGVQVIDQDEPGAPRVAGKVSLSPMPGGQQHVRIVWTVSTATGGQIGTIAQENVVPKGSLDGPWSDAAAAVAGAAADAVRGLAAQAMQQGNSPK